MKLEALILERDARRARRRWLSLGDKVAGLVIITFIGIAIFH